MGLEQLADVNRAMEQHHNTLWDVHLRQTLCDAKHLSQSCQRKSIDFFFCLWTCFHCGIWKRNRATKPLQWRLPNSQWFKNQSINMFLFLTMVTKTGLSGLFENWVKLGSYIPKATSSDIWHLWLVTVLTALGKLWDILDLRHNTVSFHDCMTAPLVTDYILPFFCLFNVFTKVHLQALLCPCCDYAFSTL